MMDAAFPLSLDNFLAPSSVAVIGASPDPHRIRGALLEMLRNNGYPGAIYPVNPSYRDIAGLRCYESIAAVGAPVDLAVIAIPAASVLPALEECAAAGVRNVIIISSGFAEDDAAPPEMQASIAALARRTGMRICGPNAEGFHNEQARVTATFSPAADRAAGERLVASQRRVGVVAQSGGMGFALYNRGLALGLPFSIIATTGNEADLTAADFFAHLARDENTAAILLFLESIRDAAGFAAAAEAARAAGKPVVALKIGRSAAGKQATLSHTASMAGWDAAYDALFHRHGITVAAEVDEALSIMAGFVTSPPARGNRVAVVTVSGGAGAWAADSLSAAGLELPALGAATQAEIAGFIPSYGATRNPVDLTAGGAFGGGTLRAITLLSRDDTVDQIAVVTSLANPARISIDGDELAALLAEQRKPVLFYSYTLPSALGRATLAEAGAVIHPSLSLLARTARALADRGQATPPTPVAPLALPMVLRHRMAAAPGAVAEYEAKCLLAACGMAIAPARLVREAAELPAAAEALGFPLAAKLQSAAIPHKTEAGGVRLGINDLSSLHAAFEGVTKAAARYAPHAAIDGVLLERMAPRGVEMIVGVVRDPTFGPVVMVGAGGVAAELFRDTTHRLAPVDEAEALAMVQSLRSAPLLQGFRGAPPADLGALTRLIALASQIAAAGRDRVQELELNPVIVHPAGQGCTVADALLVLRPQPTNGA